MSDTMRAIVRSPLALLVVVAPLAALGSWRLLRPTLAARDVAVVPVLRGELLSVVTATGTVQARRTVDIKYDTQSLVSRLFVREGDRVMPDQPVASMDVSLLQPALTQARQVLEKDRANLSLARASLDREQALEAAQVVTRAELETARANYESLLHQSRADEGAVAQAEEQVGRATLRSPIAGVVVALYVHQGEMLGSATAVAALGPNAAVSKPTNTLLTIAEESDLEVDADVNAVDLGGVDVGQPAKFVTDAFGPQVFDGIVRSIALQPTVTNGVTTYRVVIAIARPDPRLRIGLPASVMLGRPLAKNAILLPPTAVDGSRGRAAVLVLTSAGRPYRADSVGDFIVERRPVRVIGATYSAVALSGDVHATDIAIADPDPSLADGNPHRLRVHPTAFRPNPDLSDLQSERSGERGPESVPAIPGPKPRGLLEGLLGP